MNDLYLTGVSNNDVRLKNTFHLQGGGWSPFIDVNSLELNEPGPLYAVACAADADDLHVIAVTNVTFDPTNGGKLWYTTRFANGQWHPQFENVKALQSHNPGLFYEDISCATAYGLLHVLGITTGDGALWYTNLTIASTTWKDFENVDMNVPNGIIPGAFFGVSCAVIDNRDLHVMTITSGNTPTNLYHTVLSGESGLWQNYSAVQSQSSNVPGPFIGVSCSAAGGTLHFMGVTSDGNLWHSFLPAFANFWQGFDNVSELVANTPGPFTDDVGCAVADNGDLYVVATTGDGELWLTSLPAATGNRWEPFVQVKTLAWDYPGPFLAVSIASPVNFIQ